MESVLLSIVIPMYQAESYIDRCLKSIEHEVIDTKVEVLLVDDGSQDNTLNIAYNWMKKHKWIRVLQHSNRGVSYTRNKGIENANGKYIWFVDIDDNILLGSIRKIVKVLEDENPQIYVFGYRSHLAREQLNEFDTFPDFEGKINRDQDFSNYFWRLYSKNLIHNIGTKIYKRGLLLENEITFNENLSVHEDAIFCIDAICHADGLRIDKEVLYCYNLESNITSLNHQYREKYVFAVCLLFDKLDKLLCVKDKNYYLNLSNAIDEALHNEIKKRRYFFYHFRTFCKWLLSNVSLIYDLERKKEMFVINRNCRLLLRRKYFLCYANVKSDRIKRRILEAKWFYQIFDVLYVMYKRVK